MAKRLYLPVRAPTNGLCSGTPPPPATTAVDSNVKATIKATASGVRATDDLTVTTPTSMTLSVNPTTVDGGASAVGRVTLNGPAGPAGVLVTLSSKSPDIAKVPVSVTIPAGSTTATFHVTTKDSVSDSTVQIDAAGLGNLTATTSVTVQRHATLQVTFAGPSVKGGAATSVSITLSSPAPAGGTSLTLVSDDSALAPRPTITIPAGDSSITFGVSTIPMLTDTPAKLVATTATGVTGNGSVKVLAPRVQSVTCPTLTFTGNGQIVAKVTLDGNAPAGYTLACSSDRAAAVIAPTFAFPADHAVAEIPITVKRVTKSTPVTITIAGKSFVVTLLP